MVFAIAEATWLGIAAMFSSVAGVFLARASYKQNKKTAQREAEKAMHDELLAARQEAERLSEELHKLKMEHEDEESN